jgi:penicillin-binding protein 1A
MNEETIERVPVGRRMANMPVWLRVMGWLFGVVLMGCLIAAGALTFAVKRTASSLPGYEAMKLAPTGRTVRIHAVDGSLLQSLGPAYGEWQPYAAIPEVMRQAIIAIEDRRYESHWGVDPRAIGRVTYLAWKYRGTDKRLQGASTITQQAARTVFLSQRYDVRRKAKEMLIAMAMEEKLDKQRILELYLNRVYLGGGAWGIDAASRKFFGHPSNHMTLAEAALIAGLAKAPSDYAPSADPEAAYARMRVVLDVMRQTRRASDADVARAMAEKPAFISDAVPQGNGARYFTDWVKPQIDAIVGDAAGSVDVWTTFDTRLQSLADDAVTKGVPKGVQGALVSLDRNGEIRAMVGGTDYQTSSYNRATQAARQPGSSFKLFVYLTALENGYRPDSPVTDAPITISGWSPRNSTGSYAGTVPLRTAFAQSLNTVAARIGQNVGIENIARTARRFGFSTRINIDPAMVLGTSEAHLIDMTRAFASIGSGGLAVAPYGIERITVGGREVYRHVNAVQLLTAPQVARDMTSMLRGAVAGGTGRAADIGRPVAGKTGTTTSGKDGLFLGFSSGITTGVWVGRDDAKPIPALQGGRAPARIFADYMAKAVKDRPADVVDDPIAIEPVVTRGGGENDRTARDPEEDGDDGEEDDPQARPVQPRPLPTDRDGRSRAVPMD